MHCDIESWIAYDTTVVVAAALHKLATFRPIAGTGTISNVHEAIQELEHEGLSCLTGTLKIHPKFHDRYNDVAPLPFKVIQRLEREQLLWTGYGSPYWMVWGDGVCY